MAKVQELGPTPAPTADYQAGKYSDQHKAPRRSGSADMSVGAADSRLRDWSRWLDENLDVVTGAFDKLANFIVGKGITIEPMVRTRAGKLLPKVNDQIRRALLDEDSQRAWSRDVCVTGEYTRGEMEWSACRSWLRDGEILGRRIQRRSNKDAIPYQVQLIESDYLPFELIQSSKKMLDGTTENAIIHGIEKDEWGRMTAAHVYRHHPGDIYLRRSGTLAGDVIRIPARELQHLKYTRRRVGQTRGVPCIHSAIFRLDDIADYENAHRIAARVAAQIMGAINRSPDMVDGATTNDRSWEMENGTIISDLIPGEALDWYKPEAPNPDATPFLDDQRRSVATGFGMGYSTFANKYDKSFSAARQEQSENWPNIETLRAQFISDFVRPLEYEPALDAAMFAGRVKIPREADPETIYAANYRGPARPTIDDEKQAKTDQIIIESETDSRVSRIRERGRDPTQVEAEIEADTRRQQQAQPPQPQPTEDAKNESEFNA